MKEEAQLLPQHAALLTASGINEPVVAARGYRSVKTKAELRGLGFSEPQARVPALLIPIWNVHGQIATYQTRADAPRIVDGRPVKYEIPRGSRMVLDVPPSCRPKLGDPGVPLFVTEGVRKADAAASVGLCCVDVIGVWSWRGTNEDGGKTVLPDWESIALNDRVVYLVFDSDVMTKRSVHQALARLREFLRSRHADVRIIYLPAGPGGAKVGLDDYLVAGHTVDVLLALATTELRRHPDDDLGSPTQYRATPTGLVWDKPTANGTVSVPLTTFGARILAQVVEDDGAEQRRLFEIEGTLAGRSSRFRLATAVFGSMNWPTEHLGATAVTYAGMGIRDHARVAIQLLSGEVPERVVYAHTGWREIDGEWLYLHAGGAIGPVGTIGPLPEGRETHLEGALARYLLPDPPSGAELQTAVRASLCLLDLAPDRLTVPLLAATYRAVLGVTDASLHLAGPTGAFKTELAALAQQHFGAAMDSRNLPGSWSSTANLLEAVAFAAKDALFVVDDFAPAGSPADVLRIHRDADRLLRAAGNGAGRGRMRADTSLRPAKPPRGLIVSTGEDVPRGQSLRARMLVLDIGPDDIDVKRLTACQADAVAGVYAAAMAGFIRSVASRYSEIQSGLRSEMVRLRARAGSGSHRRTPEIVANLAIGIEAFLRFAESVGSIGSDEHQTLSARCWTALVEAAAGQAEHQAGADPVARFVELLRGAINSGRSHVAGGDGSAPSNAGAWGWRSESVGGEGFDREVWRPGRDRIGWVVDGDLFLDPEASFAAAQSMGRDVGDPLVVQPRTLHRRLHQAGALASVDERGRLTVRRTLAGARRTVLHISASLLIEASQPSQPAQDGDVHPQNQATPNAQSARSETQAMLDGPAAPAHSDVAPVSASLTEPAPDEEISTWTA